MNTLNRPPRRSSSIIPVVFAALFFLSPPDNVSAGFGRTDSEVTRSLQGQGGHLNLFLPPGEKGPDNTDDYLRLLDKKNELDLEMNKNEPDFNSLSKFISEYVDMLKQYEANHGVFSVPRMLVDRDWYGFELKYRSKEKTMSETEKHEMVDGFIQNEMNKYKVKPKYELFIKQFYCTYYSVCPGY